MKIVLIIFARKKWKGKDVARSSGGTRMRVLLGNFLRYQHPVLYVWLEMFFAP